MKTTHLLLTVAGLATSTALSGQFIVLDDFESFDLGVRAGNAGGSFTIVDGVGTLESGKAAMIDTPGMTHKFAWAGDPQPVITVAFDLFSGSGVAEPQPLRFAFNLNSGGLGTGTNNVARLAIRPTAFDWEGTTTESYTDDSVPADQKMTLYIIFNSTAAVATNGSVSVDPNTTQLWREINGVITHVGDAAFMTGKEESPLAFFGFTTSSTYTAGDFVVDNLRVANGVAVVPEPGTYALLVGLFAAAWIMIRRRR